jgi:hypothetical protein
LHISLLSHKDLSLPKYSSLLPHYVSHAVAELPLHLHLTCCHENAAHECTQKDLETMIPAPSFLKHAKWQ